MDDCLEGGQPPMEDTSNGRQPQIYFTESIAEKPYDNLKFVNIHFSIIAL